MLSMQYLFTMQCSSVLKNQHNCLRRSSKYCYVDHQSIATSIIKVLLRSIRLFCQVVFWYIDISILYSTRKRGRSDTPPLIFEVYPAFHNRGHLSKAIHEQTIHFMFKYRRLSYCHSLYALRPRSGNILNIRYVLAEDP